VRVIALSETTADMIQVVGGKAARLGEPIRRVNARAGGLLHHERRPPAGRAAAGDGRVRASRRWFRWRCGPARRGGSTGHQFRQLAGHLPQRHRRRRPDRRGRGTLVLAAPRPRGRHSHFGSRQDVESAIDGKATVWLLQSRPITTLLPLLPDAGRPLSRGARGVRPCAGHAPAGHPDGHVNPETADLGDARVARHPGGAGAVRPQRGGTQGRRETKGFPGDGRARGRRNRAGAGTAGRPAMSPA